MHRAIPRTRLNLRHALLTVVVVAASACADSPFPRPTGVVDVAGFPERAKGTIAPVRGFVDGYQVDYYLLAPASAQVGRVFVLLRGDGSELSPCVVPPADEQGIPVDADLATCQGPIFEQLPGFDSYTPFLRRIEVTVPADYRLNSVRSIDELRDRGVRIGVGTDVSTEEGSRYGVAATEEVVDWPVVEADGTLIDPTFALERRIGWFGERQAFFLALPFSPNLDEETQAVATQDLLVPDVIEVGAKGAILTVESREGDAVLLCTPRSVRVPLDFVSGDLRAAADVPVQDIGPAQSPVHCPFLRRAPDADADGLPDDVEQFFGPDLNNADFDGDGLLDGAEDLNQNGSLDPDERDPREPDTDGDGLPDGVEDSNADGITDPGETDPILVDSDGDGCADGEEDRDGDGVVSSGETDPREADSDGDRYSDGEEDRDCNGIIEAGETDPLDPTDRPAA